ncbi:MAG: pilus assembly protein [Pseudomonadales bacterium]|nr:pilus assembly protein [Pseudomonadales bacterium]
MKKITPIHQQQTGSVLVIGLIILLVITFIGISSISSSRLELKMANNDRNHNLALQAAEAALREGEQVADSTSAKVLANDTCTGGYCTSRGNEIALDTATALAAVFCSANYVPERWETGCGGTSLEVWTTAGRSMAYAGTAIPGVAVDPRYIIEFLSDVDCPGSAVGSLNCELFRITALGYGGTETSPVMLQSIFRKG